MALTPLHVQDVCNSGTQCRYLCWETLEDTGKTIAVCLKRSPSYYNQVKRDMDMYGVNLDERGDNCSGYLLLKYVEQGYDVK